VSGCRGCRGDLIGCRRRLHRRNRGRGGLRDRRCRCGLECRFGRSCGRINLPGCAGAHLRPWDARRTRRTRRSPRDWGRAHGCRGEGRSHCRRHRGVRRRDGRGRTRSVTAADRCADRDRRRFGFSLRDVDRRCRGGTSLADTDDALLDPLEQPVLDRHLLRLRLDRNRFGLLDLLLLASPFQERGTRTTERVRVVVLEPALGANNHPESSFFTSGPSPKPVPMLPQPSPPWNT